MADVDRRAIEAAFGDRVSELFRALCLGFEGRDPAQDLSRFKSSMRAAQAAKAAALEAERVGFA